MGVRFEILGPVRAYRDAAPVDLGPPKQHALLALLLLHDGHPVTVPQIITALWSGDPPPNAVGAVYRFIGGLRRALGPSLIALTDAGYVLRPDENALDVATFRAAAASGDVSRASALWQGDPLSGLTGPVFESARSRLNAERARLSQPAPSDTIPAPAPTSFSTPSPAPAAFSAPASSSASTWSSAASPASFARAEPANPTRAEPARARVEPTRVDPSSAGPARVDPSSAGPPSVGASSGGLPRVDLSSFDPAHPGPAPIDRTRTEPAPPDPTRVEFGRAESAQGKPAPLDSTRVESGRAESAHGKPAPLDPTRVESARADSGRADSGRADSGRAEAARGRPDGESKPAESPYSEPVDPWDGHDLFPPSII
ncbi:AfsR/SARP family transcriptional regulator [Paractinoplanes atraurantiacus]|nr:winged helix-turn-helix domain-containing protein [Actinoplanes atraurantiacus]